MGVGLAIGFPLLLALAVERVPAAHGAVVIGVVPAATAALSVRARATTARAALARQHRRPRRHPGLRGQPGRRKPATRRPWLLAAVASCAVGYVEGGRLAQRIGALQALCWAMLLLSPIALAGLAISVADRSFDDLDAGAWAGLLWAGVMSMFFGSVAWYRGLAAGGIARIGQLNLLQPLLAITWSALILREHIGAAVPLTAIAVLAAMIVALGVC